MQSIVPATGATPRAGAVLLAAGRSTRMGGPNKLLLEFDGEPMVRRALRTLQAVPLDPIMVVLGPAARRRPKTTRCRSTPGCARSPGRWRRS